MLSTLLDNDVSTFFTNCKPTFIVVLRIQSRNLPGCIILIFDNFMFVDEIFTSSLQRLETCLSMNRKILEKISFISFIFFDNLKIMSVTFSVADVNLSYWEIDEFTFTL